MFNLLRFTFFSLLCFEGVVGFSQVPTITYGGPQVYTAGTAIASLSPSSNANYYLQYGDPVIISSTFNQPMGVAVDASGNLYVSDTGNNVIKEIPAGTTTPVIIASGFNHPSGIMVDALGNIYVADQGNNVVKKIPVGGGPIVTVGFGFNAPTDVAEDKYGNIYIQDTGNGRLKEVSIAGGAPIAINSSGQNIAIDAIGNIFLSGGSIFEIPAGTDSLKSLPGAGAAAGVTVDASENIFFTVPSNSFSNPNTITQTSLIGRVSYALGSGFNAPQGLATDGVGNIFVADLGNNAIKKMSPSAGFFITPALPAGLKFDSFTGTITGTPLIVSPSTDYTVTAYNNFGGGSTTLNITVNAQPAPVISYDTPQTYAINDAITPLLPANSGGAVPPSSTLTLSSKLVYLRGITIGRSGKIYVADLGSNTVKVLPPSGGNPAVWASGFSSPTGVAVDTKGNVFVADNGNKVVKEIPAAGGTVITLASGFSAPYGIAVDVQGNIYVSDASSNQVKKIPVGGGTPIVLASGFNSPTGLAVDLAGNVFVADRGHNFVKKIPVNGGPVITIGKGFNNPNGVAVDTAGNVYVCDDGNNAIKKIPVGGGAITTIGFGYVVPVGIAIDSHGNLYVADNNNSVQKIVTGGYYIAPALPAGLTFDNANGTIKGTPTATSVPTNYVVTAYNSSGSSSASLTIGIIENANLANLIISTGNLSPAFVQDSTHYVVTETNTTSSITITPTASDTTATIVVNGTTVTSGSPSGQIPLSMGQNAITIVVTAKDGTTTKTYNLLVGRGSTSANLTNLKTSIGVLTPAFATATTSYTKSVGNTVTNITVTPTTADPTATVTVNGTTVASGTASGAIALNVGDNVINTVVTAQDGITKITYTITVTRAASADATLSNLSINPGTIKPVFTSTNTAYSVAVGNGITSITVTPTSNEPNATIKIGGKAVTSGTASAPIPLAVGTNVIATVITAQNGVTTKNYKITVTRAPSNNAKLSSLTTSSGVLSPAFNNTVTSYTRAVPNSVTSITFKPVAVDKTATITVNGVTVASGTSSAAQPLVVGSNTENIKVTAQDGVTSITYVVTVNRATGPLNAFYQPVSVTNPEERPNLDDDIILVHQGLSPNGDGINDFLQIDGILAHPDNKLMITNRSGQLVFEAKNYDNSNKVFDGHSNKTGQMQLPGTYFYSLDYTVKGEIKHKTGFIVLKY